MTSIEAMTLSKKKNESKRQKGKTNTKKNDKGLCNVRCVALNDYCNVFASNSIDIQQPLNNMINQI